MPSPLIHLALGLRCLGRSRWSPGEHAGAFALGLVAPDVRHLTGARRPTTHFWDSRNDVSGVVKLFAQHPALVAHTLSPSARQAYLFGYVCHLLADEQWIFCIYRKYFGRHSSYGGSSEGHALLVVLNDVIEMSPQLSTDVVAGAQLLDGTEPPLDLPWARADDVARWGQIGAAASQLPPGLPRARYVVEHLPRLSAPEAAKLLDNYRQRTETVAAYVDQRDVQTFVRRATTTSYRALAAAARRAFVSPPAQGLEGILTVG